MSKDVRLQAKACEVTNDLEHLSLEQVKKGIATLSDRISKWCYLLHDKDTDTRRKPR